MQTTSLKTLAGHLNYGCLPLSILPAFFGAPGKCPRRDVHTRPSGSGTDVLSVPSLVSVGMHLCSDADSGFGNLREILMSLEARKERKGV